MTTQEPDAIPDETALTAAPTSDVASTANDAPPPPRDMTPAEQQELQARSTEIVQQLEAASGSKEMEIIDGITAVGIQAQRQAGGELEILRTRVGDLISNEGAGGQVAKDLVQLRVTLNRINPAELSNSPIQRILSFLPFHQKLIDTLERIAVRYETVSSQAVTIEHRLREGGLMLRRDNIELRKMYEDIEAQQLAIKKNAYLGELLMKMLQDLHDRTTDERKKERVQTALFDVSSRVQDLRTMEEVHNQFFVSIDMTRENNARLAQSVERTIALATNTLMVGLAIQSALARQRRVLEATERTREFLGELIVNNAAAIKQHTTEIGDVYKSPVIAMDKLTQAHNDLLEALNLADKLEAEGIEVARANISKLRELSAQLETKLTSPSIVAKETPSIEA